MTEVNGLEKPRYKNWIPAKLVRLRAPRGAGAAALRAPAGGKGRHRRLHSHAAFLCGAFSRPLPFARAHGAGLCGRRRAGQGARCRAAPPCQGRLGRPWPRAGYRLRQRGAGCKIGQGAPPRPRHRPRRLGQGLGVQPKTLRGQRPSGGRLRPRRLPQGRRGKAALRGRRVRRCGEQLRLSRSALPAGQAGAHTRSPARRRARAARSPCRTRSSTAAFTATRRRLWTPCARTSRSSTSPTHESRASPPVSSTPA